MAGDGAAPMLSSPSMDADYSILSQRESSGCWLFEIEAAAEDGTPPRRHVLRLAWPDYDLLSPGGDVPPERVAAAVFVFMRDRPEFAPLPARLDAAWPRRKVEGADRLLAASL